MPIQTESPLIYSLVNNPCISDARVLKQAKSLVLAGYKVKIFARSSSDAKRRENIDGFEICRFSSYESNINIDSHIDSINRLFGVDADIVIENCKQYALLAQTQASFETLDKMLSPMFDRLISSTLPSGFVSRTLSRYKSLNHLKALICEKPSFNFNAKNRSYQDSYHASNKQLVAAKDNNFFFANYFLYCANLLSQTFDQTPDVIHAHDLFTLPAAVALKNITGAKLIYDAHELEAERAPPLPPARKNFITRIETRQLLEIDGMITVCESIAKVYEQKDEIKRPLTVVMNTPELVRNLTNRRSIDIRSRANLSENTPLIVYTGGVGGERRGMDKVVESLIHLPGFHLVIMGPSNQINDQWLLSIASKAGVTEQIHFLSPVQHNEVVDAISSGDIGIIAFQDVTLNHRYALPNKLFEMMFAGLPLCVSNLPEMKKIVLDNNIGVVMNQANPASIAKAIKKVYDNRSTFAPDEKMFASIVEKYEWKKQGSNVVKLYKELLRL